MLSVPSLPEGPSTAAGEYPHPPLARSAHGRDIDDDAEANGFRSNGQQPSTGADVTSEHATTGAVLDLRTAIDAIAPRGEEERTKSPDHPPVDKSLTEALGASGAVSSTRHTPRHVLRHTPDLPPVEGGPLLLRDQTILRVIVDCRFLSTAQINRYLLPSSVTAVRRCLHRLRRNGWITLWESWASLGGRPRYALPTRKALSWVLTAKRRETQGTTLETLARTLIPTPARRPVAFSPRSVPPFLAHQCATNDIMLTLKRDLGDVTWATSWDRPLPQRIGLFPPPQPDAVLVIDRGSEPFLLFIELDRGTQHEKAFARGKSRYAGLAVRPKVLREFFGVTAFHVVVVAQCPTEALTLRRIRDLTRIAENKGFAHVLTVLPFPADSGGAQGLGPRVQASLPAQTTRVTAQAAVRDAPLRNRPRETPPDPLPEAFHP